MSYEYAFKGMEHVSGKMVCIKEIGPINIVAS